MTGRKSSRISEKSTATKGRRGRKPATVPKKTVQVKKVENDNVRKRKRSQRVEIVVEASGSSSEEEDSEEVEESDEDDSDSDEDAYIEEQKVSNKRRKTQTRSLPTKKAHTGKKIPAGKKVPAKKKKPTLVSNRNIQRINSGAVVSPLRQVNQIVSTEDDYALARERLHVSAVPDSLPCREDEFMEIAGYLENAIQEDSGLCIYISGVPGTGKTATVHEVIRYLQQQKEEKNIPEFDFAEINGMKLTDPNQAYSILWECMNKSSDTEKKKKYTPAHAQQLLEDKFSKPNDNQRVTVVLMDELDLLVTRKQMVMYNFFDWPNRPLSKLIVVAIANTMDLPERLLKNKVASRMGLSRINFQPYRYDQLIEIVQSRLEGIDAFAKDSVEFAARKVSAVSGDARRALDICRRAVEIVEQRALATKNTATTDEKKMQVTIAVIDGAIKEMFTSPSVSFIRSCSLHQKIFLVSCMQRSRAIGLAETEFGDIAHYHAQTCKWHNIEPLNTSDLMRVCESLGQSRALVMEGGRMDIYMRISLNLMEEDIVMACKADKLISKLLQNLPSAKV
ncbi:Origin recognition complex, subunit 1 [Rhizopus stolonifer]|uniref:Cell division control protein n=1 Tax=Rhizopus stolonifer TaxID=4846 RepID=A0A367KIC6_RHIST|nr:Origin recognition complex, subunit 1 [Rhizopus stolonifer]